MADNDDTGTIDPQSIQDTGIRSYIEKMQSDLQAERAKSTDFERRTIFAEAGLSEHPARELLEKAYESGMTAEALRGQAEKYGLLSTGDGAAQQQNQEPDNRADLDASRRIQQASGGAATGGQMDFGDALARARSPQEWEAIMAQAPPESGIRLAGTAGGHRIV